LRDIFAVFVILGLGLALYRRFVAPGPRLRTNAMDSYLILLLGIIILSGVLLEGLKIVSYSKYEEMVEDYADTDEKEELACLESLWVEKYGLVSPEVKGPFDQSTLEKGYDLHEMSCAACHSRPQWAFLGYGISRAVKPAALTLDRAHVPSILWTIHFLACFLALASLPFTKFFHMITGPLSLMANAIMERGRSEEANLATKEAMELDACTHCGLCTAQCSVGILVEKITNENILPSEKMVSLKALASGRKLSQKDLGNIVDGIYLCTNCNRCTVVCPVGINLKDLWLNVREYLLQRGRPEVFVLSPFSFYRGLMKEAIPQGDYQKPLDSAVAVLAETYRPAASAAEPLTMGPDDRAFQGEVALSEQAKTYSGCFGCQTCTTVCPVVGAYDDPGHEVGLLPHQIMHAVALGMRNLAFGSRMLWDCLTCYQCQEQCPQGVCVTDVFYELKNMAVKHFKEKASL